MSDYNATLANRGDCGLGATGCFFLTAVTSEITISLSSAFVSTHPSVLLCCACPDGIITSDQVLDNLLSYRALDYRMRGQPLQEIHHRSHLLAASACRAMPASKFNGPPSPQLPSSIDLSDPESPPQISNAINFRPWHGSESIRHAIRYLPRVLIALSFTTRYSGRSRPSHIIQSILHYASRNHMPLRVWLCPRKECCNLVSCLHCISIS